MAAVSQVPHFGHGSNSADGPASLVDHEDAVFGDLVNSIRSAWVRSSGSIYNWMLNLQSIHDMETLYDGGLFYRAVIESCNQEFIHDYNYFRDLTLRSLLPREYYLATVINKYLSKNDLKHATERICSLHSSEIQQIKGIYPSLFGRELEDDIETFTFGEHRKLLQEYICIASAPRGDRAVETLRQEQLEEILRSLNKNVIETFKCPRMAIGSFLFGLQEEHMGAVVNGYHEKYGRPLEKDLTLANYGHVEHALVTKIKCAVNRPGYHAEKLHKAFGAMRDANIQGMIDADHHIDYETIVMVITTVAEGDMMMMKEEYRRKSGGFTLENDISEAFADRQDCLHLILMILNSNAPN